VYVFWNVSIISYVFYLYTRNTDGRGKPASYLLVAMGHLLDWVMGEMFTRGI
jgi:hypothetical protein